MLVETNPIHHVSDTALWVAYYRACESERADALFTDPFARTLAGDKGRLIAEHMSVTAAYSEWTVVIRTWIIDRYIERLIASGVDLVLNLGAGLDTRPYRMSLPQALRWVEIDFPETIKAKDVVLNTAQPRCDLEKIGLDLSDREARRACFAKISGGGKKVLVLTEGVLPYLTEEQASDLAADLHACPSFQYWIIEFYDKAIYRFLNNPRRRQRMAKAPFRFFPAEWIQFFDQRGWQLKESQYFGEVSQRLGRQIPAPWWWSILKWLVPPSERKLFQRRSAYLLLEKTNKKDTIDAG